MSNRQTQIHFVPQEEGAVGPPTVEIISDDEEDEQDESNLGMSGITAVHSPPFAHLEGLQVQPDVEDNEEEFDSEAEALGRLIRLAVDGCESVMKEIKKLTSGEHNILTETRRSREALETMQRHTDKRLDSLEGQAVSQTGYLRQLVEFTGEYRARSNMAAPPPSPVRRIRLRTTNNMAAPPHEPVRRIRLRRMTLDSSESEEELQVPDNNEILHDASNVVESAQLENEQVAERKRECPLRWIASQPLYVWTGLFFLIVLLVIRFYEFGDRAHEFKAGNGKPAFTSQQHSENVIGLWRAF